MAPALTLRSCMDRVARSEEEEAPSALPSYSRQTVRVLEGFLRARGRAPEGGGSAIPDVEVDMCRTPTTWFREAAERDIAEVGGVKVKAEDWSRVAAAATRARAAAARVNDGIVLILKSSSTLVELVRFVRHPASASLKENIAEMPNVFFVLLFAFSF